jgi:hypothetical protein
MGQSAQSVAENEQDGRARQKHDGPHGQRRRLPGGANLRGDGEPDQNARAHSQEGELAQPASSSLDEGQDNVERLHRAGPCRELGGRARFDRRLGSLFHPLWCSLCRSSYSPGSNGHAPTLDRLATGPVGKKAPGLKEVTHMIAGVIATAVIIVLVAILIIVAVGAGVSRRTKVYRRRPPGGTPPAP